MDNTDYINNEAIENILTRTSHRSFDPERSVSDRDLNTILHAAMAAPTAVDRRPWHFIVVRNRDLLHRLASALPYCKMAADASLAIVVCGDKNRFLKGDDSTLWVQDLSAASENILLAAHALNLGAVWTSVYPHTDRMDAVKSILKPADNLLPFDVIPIGYVVRTHAPLDKWEPSRVTFL